MSFSGDISEIMMEIACNDYNNSTRILFYVPVSLIQLLAYAQIK